ncbi:molybdopterin molybdotransferase MoeA [Halalkalicoccus subterraneus]|uniref:molybdopterin molybdotransferase MoeA n=1 Tax=Halalkalicoccus subterraneus TaxID=2675002 RepID=UPI000EFB05D6|nr:molybdopterin molybdotransferase MoeA [Halalkalicoccus subterraneus]
MDGRESVARSVAVDRLLGLYPLAEDAPTVRAELTEIAGRVTAEPVTAPMNVPRYDRATMDGFAFATTDGYPLTVVGDVSPEDEPPSIDRGEAVAVATGAALPTQADVVVMREEASVTDGQLSGPSLPAGTNVYPAGATATAGERLFAAGRRFAPRHAALLRDVGIETVAVTRTLDVGVLATGTEIHRGRQPDRDSEMLANLVRRWGHRPIIEAPVPDDAAVIQEAITTAASTHDIVMTTGGTSVGGADHVVDVLREHDVSFRGVELRPGRPMTVATVDGTPVCALPGKPVAAHTAATVVVRPLFIGINRLSTLAADLTTRLAVPDDDVEFAVPVTLDGGRATPLGHADSSLALYDERFAPGRVASSTRVLLADGIVLTREALEAGERVAVVPYEALE